MITVRFVVFKQFVDAAYPAWLVRGVGVVIIGRPTRYGFPLLKVDMEQGSEKQSVENIQPEL